MFIFSGNLKNVNTSPTNIAQNFWECANKILPLHKNLEIVQ